MSEIHTRDPRATPRKMDDFMRYALSLLVGLIIGVLSSYAAFSSRVASLEVVTSQLTRDNAQAAIDIKEIKQGISDIRVQLACGSHCGSARP